MIQQLSNPAGLASCSCNQHALPGRVRQPPSLGRRLQVSASVAGQNGAEKPVPARAARSPPADRPFTNINRFVVPKAVRPAFNAVWQHREDVASKIEGFKGLTIGEDGEEVTVSLNFATIPSWEAFSLTDEVRRTHLPNGVYQRTPAKGEGFPEDFVPFVDFVDPVNAKY